MPYSQPINSNIELRPTSPGAIFPKLAQLRQSYMPVSMGPVQYGSVQILMRSDPVLRYLAPVPDERVWRRMIDGEDVIGTSIHASVASLFRFGYDLHVSREKRRSSAALWLRDFGRTALRRCRSFPAALQEAARVPWEAWRPYQKWWRPDGFSFKGRPGYWGCDEIFMHPQERFGFTPYRELVWLGYGGQDPQVLGGRGENPGWGWLSCGSTLDPYGQSRLQSIYLIHRIKEFCLERSSRGINNSISGVPIFRERGLSTYMPKAPGAETTGAAMDTLLTEVAEAVRLLDEKGFLVIRGNMDFEQLATVGFSDGWVKFLNYLDRHMQLSVELQHLTSALGDEGGARALGEVQERTKMDGIAWLASQVEPLGQELVDDVIRFNISEVEGVELDPEDLPQFRFGVTGLLDMQRAQSFVDMGGVLLAREVAEDQGLPMAEQDDIDSGEPLLQIKSLYSKVGQDSQEVSQDGSQSSGQPPGNPEGPPNRNRAGEPVPAARLDTPPAPPDGRPN